MRGTRQRGVPRVGAPDCMDKDAENMPQMAGAPGRMSWVRARPAVPSATACATVPTTETGDMAPDMRNGVTMTAWLARE